MLLEVWSNVVHHQSRSTPIYLKKEVQTIGQVASDMTSLEDPLGSTLCDGGQFWECIYNSRNVLCTAICGGCVIVCVLVVVL